MALNFENGDLKTIPHWRGLTFHRATETAVYYTSLTGLEVQKCSEKAQTLPKDHLEHHIRPRWTSQIRIEPFLARQTRFEVFWSSILKMVTWKLFPIEEAQHFTEPLKQLCGISSDNLLEGGVERGEQVDPHVVTVTGDYHPAFFVDCPQVP